MALHEAGVSQEKLASELGISSQAVNERLNKDKQVDSIRLIKAVCKLTGKHFTDFVNIGDTMLVLREPPELYGWKAQVLKGLEMLEQEIKKKV